jgi:hypothetical protein
LAAAAVGFGLLLVATITFARARLPTPQRSQQEYLEERVDSVIARFYRTGRELGNKGDSASLVRAVVLFQEVLDLEPGYAEAYAGRAATYLALGCGGFLPADDAFPKAKAAAVTALQLDSTLKEPHASLGEYYRYYEQEGERAEQEFQRATIQNRDLAGARVSCRAVSPSLRAAPRRARPAGVGWP